MCFGWGGGRVGGLSLLKCLFSERNLQQVKKSFGLSRWTWAQRASLSREVSGLSDFGWGVALVHVLVLEEHVQASFVLSQRVAGHSEARGGGNK